MIRFIYSHADLDPKDIHRQFLRAGTRPHLYSYRPSGDVWTLAMEDVEEGMLVRQVLDRLQIDYDEVVVSSRFTEEVSPNPAAE